MKKECSISFLNTTRVNTVWFLSPVIVHSDEIDVILVNFKRKYSVSYTLRVTWGNVEHHDIGLYLFWRGKLRKEVLKFESWCSVGL